jgi:hypothetical protein
LRIARRRHTTELRGTVPVGRRFRDCTTATGRCVPHFFYSLVSPVSVFPLFSYPFFFRPTGDRGLRPAGSPTRMPDGHGVLPPTVLPARTGRARETFPTRPVRNRVRRILYSARLSLSDNPPSGFRQRSAATIGAGSGGREPLDLRRPVRVVRTMATSCSRRRHTERRTRRRRPSSGHGAGSSPGGASAFGQGRVCCASEERRRGTLHERHAVAGSIEVPGRLLRTARRPCTRAPAQHGAIRSRRGASALVTRVYRDRSRSAWLFRHAPSTRRRREPCRGWPCTAPRPGNTNGAAGSGKAPFDPTRTAAAWTVVRRARASRPRAAERTSEAPHSVRITEGRGHEAV